MFNRVNFKLAAVSRPLFCTKQVRLQTNVAAVAEEDTLRSEWDQARPFGEIPTLSSLKMVRSFLPGGTFFNKDTNQLIFGIQKEYGDMFVMPSMFGRPPILFTYNPDDFERVFRVDGAWPHRPGNETLGYHRRTYRADLFDGVEGVLASQGDQWASFRSVVNPVLMQPKNMRLYVHKMSQVNKEFVERIIQIRDPKTQEVPANFEEEINRWTLESVSVVALDRQLGLLKENRDSPGAKIIFSALNEFFTLAYDLEVKPSLWKILPTPKYKRIMKALDDLTYATSDFVNEAVERLEQDKKNGLEKPEHEKSVLEKLLQMDKKIATLMAMDMLMAGVDTTSSTFTGIMLCLATNPEKQAKLREEILQILPQKDSDFTESSLKNIPYLRACIKEGLRMYPLIIGNARVPAKDVVLSGYRVPKGTFISMVSTPLLRDDKHYPRANEFLPERWLRESNAAEENVLKASSPFANLPFGFGPRMCIGKRVVEMELELGIARLIRHFHVEFNHSTENAFKSVLINVPNIPLKFTFKDV